MVKAFFKGTVVAESSKTIEVEGNQYFPPDSVNKQYLKNSDTQYTCPWKGEAKYYSLEIDKDTVKDGAWEYPKPKEAAKQIKGHIAFSPKIQIMG